MFENINICYVIFNLLYLFVILLYLKLKGVSFRKRLLVGGVYILVSIFSFSYMNSIVNSIFALKYLSVKTYLFLLVITNGIILYTMNHEVFLGYKVMNYLLFILLTIIFGANLAVVLGNKYEAFYLMDVKNAVNFIDLSLVIFLVYGVVIAVIFIGNYLFSNKVVLETKAPLKEKKRTSFKMKFPKLGLANNYKKKKQAVIASEEAEFYSLSDLLNYDRNHGFYIDGVDCSIIFEDSNQDNILLNYQILSNDIHARLVNGYTLEENRMLKDICMKLQVGSLSNVDISNVSILNKISIEEYNLLKRVFRLN